MKKYLLLLLLLLPFSVYGDGNDLYANASSWFGVDPNVGQNSFLTLLIPSGGKYESMATAYTAVALDSGYMESNPAGSVYLDKTELVFFHVDWISDSSIESLYYTFRPESNERFGLGAGFKFLHVPFTGYNEWGMQTSNVGWYSESISTLNLAYTIIENDYNYPLLSMGTNLKIGYRGLSAAVAPNQNAFAIMGDIGVLGSFNLFKYYAAREPNFSIGLSLKNLGTEFIDNSDPLPTQITTGISWKFIRPITLALDFSIPINLDGTDNEMVSGAIGINANITEFLDLQAGFLIKQGKPRFTLGSQVSLKDFDLMINYTLDLATQLEIFNRMSVGIRVNLDTVNRNIIREDVQELYLEGLKEYAAGRYESAKKYFENALSLNPNYTPAVEMLKITVHSLELNRQLRNNID